MKKVALIILSGLALTGPVHAVDHGCGTRPATPAIFNPDTATKEDVLAVKAAFEAYQAQNTTYLNCIEAFVKTEAFISMEEAARRAGIDEMNAELRAVQQEEQAYADQFNENARLWVEVRTKAQNGGG